MNQLQLSMEEEQNNRSGYLRLAREAVRERREKVALRDVRDEDKDIEIKKVLQSSNSGDEQELYLKLQRLIERNAVDVASEVESMGRKSNTLIKRIAGYTQFIGEEETNMGNQIEMLGMQQ